MQAERGPRTRGTAMSRQTVKVPVGVAAAAVAALLVIMLSACASGEPMSDRRQPPEVSSSQAARRRPRADIVNTDLATDSPLAVAVSRHLPVGSEISSVVERVDRNNADGTDAISLSTVIDRVGYEVTVFRHFHVEEMDTPPIAEDALGSVWIGAEDRDLTSIYYLSRTGVGLRVAHLHPEDPGSITPLIAIANAVAAEPAVVAEMAG